MGGRCWRVNGGKWTVEDSGRRPRWPWPTECDGMLHPMLRNVTECDGLRHPDEAQAPKNNDLREFNVTDCDDMRRNVTVSAKMGPARVGSRFKVQSWGFLTLNLEAKGNLGAPIYVFALWKNGSRTTKCPEMSHPMLRNPTEPDETRHPHGPNGTSTPSDNDLQDLNVPQCPTMSHNVPLFEKRGREPDL